MAHYADTSRYSDDENRLWEQLSQMQGVLYHTAKGLPFTFTLRGNEMFVSRRKKSITRATVNRAFQNIRENHIEGSKQLAVFGASYLYPVFKDLGF